MRRIFALMMGAACTFLCGPAGAQSDRADRKQPPAEPNDSASAPPGQSSGSGWTEERMRNAKPMPLPNVDPQRKK
jgi:hypothetical protein